MAWWLLIVLQFFDSLAGLRQDSNIPADNS